MPEMDAAKLKEIYTTMVRIRFFEERAITEYRKGLPGFIHPPSARRLFRPGCVPSSAKMTISSPLTAVMVISSPRERDWIG